MADAGRVIIEVGGMPDLPDVMVAMADAFDPEFGEAWTEAQCAGVLAMPGSWLLIARRGSDPVGFAMLRTIVREAELLLIAVRPGERRRGVARRLLDHVIAEAEQRDVAALHLEVREGNPAAALYRAAGFQQVGTRRDYYRGRSGKMFHALTFKRTLGHD